MINLREARQRCQQHQMTLSRVGGTSEFRVSFPEDSYDKAEKSAYYSDDLLDCALTASKMRAHRGKVFA